MPFGLPATIWRHTLVELLRHFLISGSVLVTVLSFAITVQPLSDGTLGVVDALRFMGLATIPMSAYALPFAAGFAATMVFHRMSQDNELLAAHAGGIGHVKLLAPVAGFGLLVSVALGGVNDQVIPRFLRTMEVLVSEDAARLFSARLEAGEPVTIDNYMVYAAGVREVPVPPGTEAREVLMLMRPAFVELDEDGNVVSDATAGRAWVWFFADDGGTRVVVRPEVVTVHQGGGRGDLADVEKRFVLPGGVRDDPKFMSLWEMLRARVDPDATNMPEYHSRRLSFWLAHSATFDELSRAIAADRGVGLLEESGQPIEIRADSAAFGAGQAVLTNANGQGVAVRLVREGGAEDLIASLAELSVEQEASEITRRPSYTLTLSNVRAVGSESVRPEREFEGVRFGPGVAEDVIEASSRDLIEMATLDDGTLMYTAYTELLQRHLASMMREILSKIHERLALTMLAMVMAMSGAVTAIVFRRGMPLQAYLATFAPSLGSVLMISLGQQVTHRYGDAGLPLLWAGVAAQAFGTVVVLMLIRRR